MPLEQIAEEIKNCKKCPLHKERNNPVPGAGDPNAEVMLIGEAPGRNEDQQGLPFVGAAGKILDELLSEAGLSRKEVFIGNIVKCRPPGNRDPADSEISACTPFLERQIQEINPKVLVGLGRFSSNYLLEKYGFGKKPISQVRGEIFEKDTLNGKIYILPVFHPAAATYDINKKSVMLEDFKTLRDLLKKQ